MAKYSSTASTLIQNVALSFDDCVMGTPSGTYATTTFACANLGDRTDDYYNGWQVHFYSGTHKDISRTITDFATTTGLFTFAAVTAATDVTDLFQLHKIFTYAQYMSAVNRAIETLKNAYLLNKVDTTLVQVNDNTLASAFTIADGHFHVTADTFPTVPFDVTIDDEIFSVTVKAGTQFTASPAQHGTTAANHAAGSTIYLNYNIKHEFTVPTDFIYISKIIPEASKYSDDYYEWDTLSRGDWSIIKDATSPRIRFEDTIGESCKWQLTGQAYQSPLTLDASVCYLPPEAVVQQARGMLCLQRADYVDRAPQAFSLAGQIIRNESVPVAPGSKSVYEV